MRLAPPPPDIAEEADRLMDEWVADPTTASFEQYLATHASKRVMDYIDNLESIIEQARKDTNEIGNQ